MQAVARHIFLLFLWVGLSTPPAFADKADDTLKIVWGSNGPIESVDLYFSTRRTTMELSGLVWDTLIWRDPDTFDYKPLLAKAWRRIDDLTLEFDLREDVKFHDGTPFSAKDVVGTLTRVADPAFKVRVPRNVNWVDKVVEVSPYRVRVISKAPFPPALDYLAMALPIYPAEYYAKVGPEGMHKAPIGSGPYRLVSVETAKAYKLQRNDAYFRDGPKGTDFIRTIEIREVPDAQTQVAELLSRRAHIIWDISSDQLDQIGRMKGFKTIQAETMRVGYIGLDAAGRSNNAALKNQDVRRTIAHAVDRKTIVSSLVRGLSALFRLGGCSGAVAEPPLALDCTVETLAGGEITATGPMYRGNRWSIGRTCLLRHRGITIMVAEKRLQCADQAILRHAGLEPASLGIIVIKSSVHFRADFERIAKRVIMARSPRLHLADNRGYRYRHLPEALRRMPAGLR